MERVLATAAAVERTSEDRYAISLSKYYSVVGRPNGGYLQCVMANAALDAAQHHGAPHRHATAITTNYIGAPHTDAPDIEIRTDVRRVGKGASFVHATLYEHGDLRTESVVVLGTLHAESPVRYTEGTQFDVAPREQCLRRQMTEDINMTYSAELLLDPSCAQWYDGTTSDRGEIKGWIRLDNPGVSWDPWSVLFATDALPPATFPLGSTGWVPTLQLTSYVRSVPLSEWLRVRQWCVVVDGDLVDERCELYDERGRLVALSSQLAMVRFPHAAS